MTLESKEEALELREQYRRQALHYLENAEEMLGKGEREKAAEMAWGALAEALKALALKRNRFMHSHGEIRRFASQLAKELQDEAISNALAAGDRSHWQFYEGAPNMEDVARDLQVIRRVLPRLLALALT